MFRHPEDDTDGGAIAGAEEERARPAKVAEGHEDDDDEKPLEKVKIRFDTTLHRDEAISYLESLVAGLRKGSIEFKRDDESLVLQPTETLEVGIKASRKGAKEKVAFELEWRRDGGGDPSIS